jgi:G:T-mismatch repair DNA endonuclease (very short patch repair protein)
MIISEKVFIVGNSRNLTHFREMGYEINVGDKILVDVNDLTNGSTFKVEVKCDFCDNRKFMAWSSYLKYTKNNTEKYNCSSCSKLKRMETNQLRYGGNSPTCSKLIVDKIKSTNKERYGNNSSLHGIRQEITENIFIDRYGHKTPLANAEIKDKIKKTLLDKYGVDHPLKNKDILENLKKTNIKKWGVDNPSKSKFVIDSIKKENLEKYGKEWYYQTEDFKQKSKKTNLDKYGVENFCESIYKKKLVINKKILDYDVEVVDYYNKLFTIRCNDCNGEFSISSDLLYHRHKRNNILCTNCNKKNNNFRANAEIEICKFLADKNIKYQTSVRNIIKGELDIYLPDYNVAIEYNGIFWHSEYFKDKNHHIKKYNDCFDKGIQLIQIWEDEWINNKDRVKSIILSKLGIYNEKIFARKCILKEIVFKEKDIFLDQNHLQGTSKSSVNLALYYNNEIVSVMTFGKRRINSKETYELIRFCNRRNTVVVGGASKLFSYFLNNYDVENIVSYSDNCISNGNIYNILNFENTNETLNYYWCDGKKRYHRFTFNKKRLVKKGYDKNKTGLDIMREIGYWRIFGAGIKTWVYKKNNNRNNL